MRIASLLPSSTEIVCALGLEEALIARSHECDYPTSVRALPAVTAPKFDPDGRSYEIDQRVKAILQEATSVYRIDADLLRRSRQTSSSPRRSARSVPSASPKWSVWPANS